MKSVPATSCGIDWTILDDMVLVYVDDKKPAWFTGGLCI